jgi:DDE superfamily endonuclease
MFRIIRVPAVLDKLFGPLRPHFHWNHWMSFRLLVLAMAWMWGRRTVTNLYRYLEVEHHRTRFTNFFLVERWAPEAALRQKAQAWLRALRPGQGEPLSLIIDDSKQAKRAKAMDAIAKMKDPTTDAYIRGHPYVCAILVYRDHVIPFGIRLSVKKAPCPTVGVPFHKTTELAAPLIREGTPPAGVKVVVLFDAYDLCPTVVKACREQQFHFASTLKSNRRLFKRGWKLHAGRDGRNRCRRRRTDTLDRAKPDGSVRDRVVDAGGLAVSQLGPLHVVFSRKGTANKILGLVTDAPQLAAADVIRTYEKRWTIEQWLKDVKQLLGLGHDQNRSYGAAVTHLHLVCCAYALLTHLRIERTGAQGQRTRHQAADFSTAAAQDQLRSLLWEDLITYLQEADPDQPVIDGLERLRVAGTEKKSVNMSY